ncbi:carbohydrate-binding protein [Thraustotheca clavata]|uniref:Carbohydrate-binding protein n=1 Tax=Thraustotheca clavata TaxID=74557 RepID=A0A1V9ZQ44_9STRA|nr:carbohydrate-binding protein [Thraustotheca clavata]
MANLPLSHKNQVYENTALATGVVYQYQGQTVTVNLPSRGAVVVAGGAVMTPKILTRSGIGPLSQLQMLSNKGNFLGIDGSSANWVINENVGDHLFDIQQLLLTLSHSSMKTFSHSQSPSSAIQQYMTQGHSGPWPSPDPVQIAYGNYNVNNREY